MPLLRHARLQLAGWLWLGCQGSGSGQVGQFAPDEARKQQFGGAMTHVAAPANLFRIEWVFGPSTWA